MHSSIRRCRSCGRYTLRSECCGSPTFCPIPPRYSPEDRMGEYRRKTIIERYGEDGKLDRV